MPVASALFVKSAWVWFLTGLALGLAIALHKALGWYPWVRMVFSTPVHVLLVGFVAQWIMGMAYWFSPRVPGGPFAPRHRLAIASWALLNTGVLLRGIGEAGLLGQGTTPWQSFYLTSVGMQAGGGLLFVFCIWGRIRCSIRLVGGRASSSRLLLSAARVMRGEEIE